MISVEMDIPQNGQISCKPAGLVDGPYGGWLMEYYDSLKKSTSSKFKENGMSINQMIMAFNSASHYNYSLGYGLTGLLWTIQCRERKSENFAGLFDENVIFPILEAESIRLINARNYDLFSGVNGIIMYLMRNNKLSDKVYDSYVKSLMENLDSGELILPTSTLVQNNRKLSGINLGIPHGVTGCVLILIQLYEYNPDSKCQVLLDNVVKYLLEKRKLDNYGAEYFTYSDHAESEKVPLAWCYGDLSTGYAIIKAGKSLQKSKYIETGISILNNTLERNDFANEDLSMCHGAPCIAYIYNKAWLLSGIKRYSDRSGYWAEKTRLFLDKIKRGVYSHIKTSKNFLENDSLIYGYPGTQLALRTMEGRISSEWDCWMLL